jgi:phosphoribosylformylglycinamidine (FGAM) synthase-like enzyme
VDFDAEQRLARVLTAAAERGLLTAAHDLSDGGLAVALAESCLAGGVGCTVTLPGDPFTFLFSESAARAVVTPRPGAEDEFGALCVQAGLAAADIGQTGGTALHTRPRFRPCSAEARYSAVHQNASSWLAGCAGLQLVRPAPAGFAPLGLTWAMHCPLPEFANW